MEAVKNELGAETSEIRFDNMTKEDLKNAAEMFIYYNLCPKFMYEWTTFYIDLMQNASPDVIVLTLNRIMVTGRKKGDKMIENIAKKIFKYTSENF